MDALNLILFLTAAFLGGLTSGLSGFAMGLVVSGVWLHIIAPDQNALLIVLCGLVTQSSGIWKVRRDINWRTAAPFIIGSAIGVPGGTALLATVDASVIRYSIGALLVVFSLYSLFRPALQPVPGNVPIELGVGVANGVIGGLTGLGGIAVTIWSQLRGGSKDVQRAVFPDPPGPAQSIAYTVNVPEARVSGLEIDAMIKPLRWLETGVSGSLTKARFVNGKDEADVFGTLYVFGPYADAPRLSGSAYASLLLPTPAQWGVMDVRADIYSQSHMYFSNSNDSITPDTRIPGYSVINLRYDWTQIHGSRFSLAAFVRNLTEKEYYTGGFALTGSLGVNSVAIGTPRMYGAELSYEF